MSGLLRTPPTEARRRPSAQAARGAKGAAWQLGAPGEELVATTYVTTGVRQASWLAGSLFFGIAALAEVARGSYGWLLVLPPVVAILGWARPRTGELRVTATHLTWTRFWFRTATSEVPLEQLGALIPSPAMYSALYALPVVASGRLLGTIHLAERDATELVRRVALRRRALGMDVPDAAALLEAFEAERALGMTRVGDRWEPFWTATELRALLDPKPDGSPFRAAPPRGVVAMRASDTSSLGANGLVGFEVVAIPEER